MWQILKTEFNYTKDALMFAYTIALLFFIVANLWSWGIHNFMWNTTITYFILRPTYNLPVIFSKDNKLCVGLFQHVANNCSITLYLERFRG